MFYCPEIDSKVNKFAPPNKEEHPALNWREESEDKRRGKRFLLLLSSISRKFNEKKMVSIKKKKQREVDTKRILIRPFVQCAAEDNNFLPFKRRKTLRKKRNLLFFCYRAFSTHISPSLLRYGPRSDRNHIQAMLKLHFLIKIFEEVKKRTNQVVLIRAQLMSGKFCKIFDFIVLKSFWSLSICHVPG